MFSIAATVALNYQDIKWIPERVSNIKPFINKLNQEKINYLPKIDNWKTFEKNSRKIAFNIFYTKEKEICPIYISKNTSNCEKTNNSINDSKRRKRKMALSCSKKNNCMIKRINIKTS